MCSPAFQRNHDGTSQSQAGFRGWGFQILDVGFRVQAFVHLGLAGLGHPDAVVVGQQLPVGERLQGVAHVDGHAPRDVGARVPALHLRMAGSVLYEHSHAFSGPAADLATQRESGFIPCQHAILPLHVAQSKYQDNLHIKYYLVVALADVDGLPILAGCQLQAHRACVKRVRAMVIRTCSARCHYWSSPSEQGKKLLWLQMTMLIFDENHQYLWYFGHCVHAQPSPRPGVARTWAGEQQGEERLVGVGRDAVGVGLPLDALGRRVVVHHEHAVVVVIGRVRHLRTASWLLGIKGFTELSFLG